MRKLLLIFLVTLSADMLHAQDIIVTKSGDVLKAFNVEIGGKTIFYQQTSETDASIQKMAKEDVLVIKFQDGRQVVMNEGEEQTASPTTTTPSTTGNVADPKANEEAISAIVNN